MVGHILADLVVYAIRNCLVFKDLLLDVVWQSDVMASAHVGSYGRSQEQFHVDGLFWSSPESLVVAYCASCLFEVGRCQIVVEAKDIDEMGVLSLANHFVVGHCLIISLADRIIVARKSVKSASKSQSLKFVQFVILHIQRLLEVVVCGGVIVFSLTNSSVVEVINWEVVVIGVCQLCEFDGLFVLKQCGIPQVEFHVIVREAAIALYFSVVVILVGSFAHHALEFGFALYHCRIFVDKSLYVLGPTEIVGAHVVVAAAESFK